MGKKNKQKRQKMGGKRSREQRKIKLTLKKVDGRPKKKKSAKIAREKKGTKFNSSFKQGKQLVFKQGKDRKTRDYQDTHLMPPFIKN